MTLRVAALFVHPIKSAAAIAVDAAAASPTGLAHDRRWMFVDPDGAFVTQRELPALARISVTLDAGSDGAVHSIRLDSPGRPPLRVITPTGALREVEVWGDRCMASDAGADAAAWLEALLGRPLSLVHLAEDALREVDTRDATGHRVGFADAFPYLIVGEASLADVAARGGAGDARRFRPNIVVSGAGPFAEDGWRRIAIGGLELTLVKPCSRCTMVDIDPARGERAPGTLAAIAPYRKLGHKVLFGQNAVADGSAVVRVGDEVRVLETQTPALG